MVIQAIKKLLTVNVVNLNQTFHFLKMPYYAVAKGRTPGIFMTWADCESQVKGFSGARYKKFDSAAQAEEFINTVNKGSNVTQSSGKNYKQKSQKVVDSTNIKTNDFKRSHSKSSSVENSHQKYPKKRKAAERDSQNSFSDDTDDLDTIISKQLDDVEQRLAASKKTVDKIINKSIKGQGRKIILIEPPKPEVNDRGFETDSDGYVNVYTDGACSGNGTKAARAGIGVYWGESHSLNISEPVSGRATNNCGEIQAATKAIKIALDNGVQKLAINTDSQFLINSITKWLPGWKNNGWKLKSGGPVKNEKDFKDLDNLKNQLEIKWNYVEAHQGVHGNEMADGLAKAGAAMYQNK